MKVGLIVAGLAMFAASPVLAAEYYVAKHQSKNKCKIVEEKPDGKTMVMVGTSSYATKEQARAAKKAAQECPKKQKAK